MSQVFCLFLLIVLNLRTVQLLIVLQTFDCVANSGLDLTTFRENASVDAMLTLVHSENEIKGEVHAKGELCVAIA